MESQLIHLNSSLDKVGDNRSHLKFEMNPPMKLNPKKKHYLKLMQSKIPITVYNITSSNNTYRYKMVGTDDWTVVTLPTGIYDVSLLNNAMKYYYLQNGDYSTTGDPEYNVYPFQLYGNPASGKCYLVSDQADRHIDFTNGGASTLYEMLGWEEDDDDLDSSDGLYLIATNEADFGGDFQSFYIHSNLVETRDRGNFNDIIYYSAFVGDHYSAMLIPESNYDTLIPLRHEFQSEIRTVELRITNIDGTLLTFNGNSKDSEVYITLAVVSIKD